MPEARVELLSGGVPFGLFKGMENRHSLGCHFQAPGLERNHRPSRRKPRVSVRFRHPLADANPSRQPPSGPPVRGGRAALVGVPGVCWSDRRRTDVSGGTIVGYRVTSLSAFVLSLALAAEALFCVIGEMFAVGRRLQAPVWAAWGIAVGFLIAYGTDVVLVIGGV